MTPRPEPSPLPPSRSATALLGALCREVSGPDRPLVRKALTGLRRARLAVGDPAVRYRLDGTDLLVPLSHELPVHRARHPEYSRNLGALAAAVAATRPDASVVDIGANVGDSVAIVAARADLPVLCVEADPTFLPYLDHNVRGRPGVEVARCYVASADIDLSRRSVDRAGGTAKLVDRTEPNGGVVVQPLDAILRDHPRFVRPALLKIDTDGHDAGIIASAHEVLADCHPVLFFEYDPPMTRSVGAPDPLGLFDQLVSWGYERFVVWANTGEEIGRYGPDDTAQLRREAATLDPAAAVAYWDVAAFHPADLDVLDHLPAPGRPVSGALSPPTGGTRPRSRRRWPAR